MRMVKSFVNPAATALFVKALENISVNKIEKEHLYSFKISLLVVKINGFEEGYEVA